MTTIDELRAQAAQLMASRAALIGQAATQARPDRATTLAGVNAIDGQLAGIIAGLAGDPCDLETEVPLALLPVRLETRYSADGTSLRVRIFPDDIHIDRLDRGVADDERAAAVEYWTSIWAGTATEDGAWQTLLTAVHPDRAAWVASATVPDLSLRPDPPGPAPAPVCAPTTPRQQRPAVARGLPDRFVVAVVQDGVVRTAVGRPVPPELVVGLPPDGDPSQLIQQGKVVLGPGMAWLIDPSEAAAAGMLVEVPLAKAAAPVDLVLAFGVRAGLDPAAAGALLSDLLDGHRFVSGAGFVAPGSPTNNTETDRTDWTRHPEPAAPATRPVPAPSAGSDAAVTAGALGIDASHLSAWANAGATDQPLAGAAHTALWQATWGTFLDRLLVVTAEGPSIGDGLRETWRDWWQQSVRGRGPLPLLRVGDQPYGVLPVAAVQGHWQPSGADGFEAALLNVLRNARRVVAGGLPNVPRVEGAGPLDDTLLEILGSAPHLLGLRVRSVATETLVSYAGHYFGIGGTNQPSQDALDVMLWAQLGLPIGSVGLRGALGAKTAPLGLPLVDDSDPAFIAACLADQARTVKSVLQALIDLAASRELAAITQSAPGNGARHLVDLGAQVAGDLAPEIIGVTNLTLNGQVDPARLHATADRVSATFGAAGPSALAAQQPIAAVRTNLAADVTSPRQALTALGAWLRAQARWAEFQSAATVLAKATTADRAIVVAEALDCASHRYDAWVTALPTRRLAQLRATTPAGVLLGAYGWVENLSPGAATTRPGGFVHAPSLTHAATAGVLRSGYLTHNPDMSGSGAMAVDLSSARVRHAMDLLDGVRQGQTLGALLGYLVERRLHERGLDRFTLSIRALAPILAGRLTGRADAQPDEAQESIAANNVVDGLRLLQLARPAVHASIAQPPAANPYLQAGSWTPPSPDELTALDGILDETADAYDAVADVLLAESVHHLVQGNTARAAAAMDAAAGGDAAPIEPEVVRTPTRATAVTHRVLVVLDDTPAGAGGWSAATPRARAEPRLAAWAERRIGPATAIVVHVGADGTPTTLDAASVSALDLVFDSADAGALDRSLRAALPSIGTDPLVALRDPAWPEGRRAIGEVAVMAAGLLRVIAGSQPLTPASLARPNDPPERSEDPSGLAARLGPVVDDLASAVDGLAASLGANPQDPTAIAGAVDGLRRYGISLPAGGTLVAEATLAEGRARHAAATAALAVVPFSAEQARVVAGAALGSGFTVVAPVVAGGADLYGSAFGALQPPPGRLRRWLRDIATVRPAVARYAEGLLFADAMGGVGDPAGPTLRVAQLAAPGSAGTATWLGLALPDGTASPDQPVTDLVIEVPPGYSAPAAVAGLVVDEWVEQLPRRNADGTATVTTGLAVNAASPNARAPQAVLLAIAADQNRWSTNGIIDLLTETLELAKLRAVTLERTTLVGRILPALQEQSWSLQGEETLDIRFLATEISSTSNMLAFVKDEKP